MGLDTEATLFYGISDGEEDPDALEDDWWDKQGLDPPPDGIELDICCSYACPVPFIYSKSICQTADGDTNTVTKLDPWPPRPPTEAHIIWLYKAAKQLGWPGPDWHLAVTLKQG